MSRVFLRQTGFDLFDERISRSESLPSLVELESRGES